MISAESRFILCEAIIPCVLGSPGRSTLVKECLVKKINKRFVSKNIFRNFAPKLCFSMKKLYTIVWLLMTSLVLSAAEISQEQALENARSFMLQNIEGGGYVIASADDRTLPVLGYTNRWNYLNAKQQSADLHAIVAAIKKSGIVGNGKWLATGVSKNGMTTAHYAYHYPNEMDAYVGLHNDYIDQWNFSERAELFKWLNQLGFLANE